MRLKCERTILTKLLMQFRGKVTNFEYGNFDIEKFKFENGNFEFENSEIGYGPPWGGVRG